MRQFDLGRTSRTVLAVLFLGAHAVVVPSAQSAPAGVPDSFVGNWYGVGEPDDMSISYIDAYNADGTFHSEFRKCEGTRVVWSQTETGKWSVANGVLRMTSDTIDGKPDHFDNFYTIEQSTPIEFHARLQNPDFLFIEKRIDKFEFPPCYVGA